MKPTMLTGLLLIWICLNPALAAPPQRVVSLNLCSDQLLLMLADREQVARVSHLATDPHNSYMAAQAQGISSHRARLEEIIAAQPDLILTTPYTSPRLRHSLEQLGYPLYTLKLGLQPEQIVEDIRGLADRLEQSSRGETLIQEFLRRIAAPPESTNTPPPSALFLQPRGYTSGRDTLQDQALRLAGWRNRAAEMGLEGYVQADLEQLIAWQPDALVTSPYAAARDSRAERLLSHPALKRLFGAQPLYRVPYKDWICPGPMLADAVKQLRRARSRTQQP
ncbi:MAG: ABC transporter substrate-binding protein [Candidatus Thiodiazotropha sp.]